MKGRFQPTTVGNMVKCDDGGYVCFWDYKQLQAENAALREQLTAAQKDAERYRWIKKQPYFAVPLGSTFDAAIDSLMKEQGE